MSDNYVAIGFFLYLISAVFFVIISKKCFMEKWHIGKAIACFLLSPSMACLLSNSITFEDGANELFFGSSAELIVFIINIAGIQLAIQLVMLFIYVKLMHAKNASIAVFIYLCSTMLIPNIYLIITTKTILPFFFYVVLHILFYFSTVRPLSEMTRTRQITDAKLFVILPAATFVFNTVIFCIYYYTIKVSNLVVEQKDIWVYALEKSEGELFTSAKALLEYYQQYLAHELDIILYPSIFVTAILFIAFYVIVRNIRFMNETIETQQKIKELSVEVMEALAHTIDAKDEYTKGHSIRVAKYSRMIAEQMKLPAEKCEDVYYMGLLHDLGKIGVPNEIINKPSRLTDEEYDVIKKHPVMGYDILAEIKSRPDLTIGARWHHERFDGNGYPDHKKGEEIPLEARIIAVADTYDAMTSNRSYRNYLPQATVRAELEKCSGTQFDANVAKAMLEIIDADKEYVLHE